MEGRRLVIAGPTASGKTALALLLARKLDGEIVSADSRQVHKEVFAGTAKPVLDAEGRIDGVPYHLTDFVNPSDSFDAGSFARLAGPLIGAIESRGHLPIICGGTGLYIQALEEGLSLLPKADPRLRSALGLEAEKSGRRSLHEKLAAVDAEAASKIPPNNLQRVIRALEVYHLTGRPISRFWNEQKKADGGPSRWAHILVEWPKGELKARIEERARRMWPGILDETARLAPKLYCGLEPAFQSLGYQQALRCLGGKLPKERGLAEFIARTLAYAKRQKTWFRRRLKPPVLVVRGNSAERMADEALKSLAALF